EQRILREWIAEWVFDLRQFSLRAQPLARGDIGALQSDYAELSATLGAQEAALLYQEMYETRLRMPAMEVVIAGAQYYVASRHHQLGTSEPDHEACLRFLGEINVSVDSADVGGFTAFMRASQTSHSRLDLAAVLLDLGASVNHRSRFGGVALHEALMAQDRKAVSGESAEGVLRSLDVCADNDEEDDDEGDGADVIQFHPVFTYQMYGQQERVFGYKGLRINLHYAAGSLATFLDVAYTKRVDQMETSLPVILKADDIETPMRNQLSANALCSSKQEFASRVAVDTREFRPYGKKCHEYMYQDTTYEIYDNAFDSEEFCEYHRRMQTFLLFYIEGAQFIDTSDEKWRVFTVFEKLVLQGVASYSLVGYCTMYQFFHYPDRKRPRISQFLVLPPFQGQGHGSQLYRFIYSLVQRTPEYADLTVEDPSESFDDMRDRNDMR
ncbi:histone acetyltransferase 1, partial [Coemansia sp. RSA 2399]